ncbi:MAG: NAD-dependent epimerase/dehydratase family protein [Gammaproteobacteria bacterium]|nr:NAD-dependent epimerase/dehydratase family protein [Gammaproteobacteria bacterium]
MKYCQAAQAFLHVSSCAVYHPAGHEELTEKSPLGDNHRTMFATYSVGKNAQEAVVRLCARAFDLPSIICRLNVPYGNNGGWPYYHLLMMENGIPIPVNTDARNSYTLIHEDDIVRTIPALVNAASVPAEIVNWSGHEHVSIEEWCGYIGELTGLEPQVSNTRPGYATERDEQQCQAGASWLARHRSTGSTASNECWKPCAPDLLK